MGARTEVLIVSPMTARAARERLRRDVRSTTLTDSLELQQHDRIVVGRIDDPRFEVTSVGPSTQGRTGPVRWRAPYRSRQLVGTIVDDPTGGSVLEGRFRPRAPGTMARRREEQHLVEWLTAALVADEDG
jgi:hypothetical protein